jgi:probable F420-dependent oxidoreductase
MKLGTGIAGPLAGIARQAQRAEELGYDFLACPEMQHDSMLSMCMAAANTQRIELQTSVTIAFPRAPMVLAMQSWDLQALSRGRFILGLGSQVKGHNERRFSVGWSAPAPRMKEYVKTLLAIWNTFQTGAKADFVGKHYQFTLMTPNFNPGPLETSRPRVFMAMVGPGMARAAGEVADGIVPHGFMTDRYLREVLLPNVKIGLERAGRSWKDIELTGGGFTVFGENESEIEQRLEQLRQPISFYGSTRSYHDVFELHGWRELGEKLHALSVRGKWEEMRAAIPHEVLRGFAQTATYNKIPDFVREHREYASRITFMMPTGSAAERERFEHVRREVQAIQTPGVPRGLA